MKIQSKYLVFRVNPLLPRKNVVFSLAGKEVYRLRLALDETTPSFFAYIDVSRFCGAELYISVTPQVSFSVREADEMEIPNLYREPLRPQVHFTTKNGWNNDPNGLIFLNGVYHMFYQHNPGEPRWENMHWGHAVSTDLFHWEERDAALFPDEMGTMFSGCAIKDERNLLLHVTGINGAGILYYTAAGKPFTQCMAYSTDGFNTLQKYEGNPILPHVLGGNRDPKVIFCDELGCYVMALYLAEHIFALYTSRDLLKWEELQRIPMEDDRECPDFFPLTADDGARKWVLIGASDHYLVGVIKDGRFQPQQPEQSLHYGISAYAGQSFHGIPNGRVIRIDWERWGELSAAGFSQQMSIPTELSLLRDGEIYRLSALPVREIETLYGDERCFTDVALRDSGMYSVSLKDSAYLIRLLGAYETGLCLSVSFFGRTLMLDTAENTLTFGKRKCPLSYTKSELNLSVIIDRCSVEIYSDRGRVYFTDATGTAVMDRGQPCLTVTANRAYTLHSLRVQELKSIWEDA